MDELRVVAIPEIVELQLPVAKIPLAHRLGGLNRFPGGALGEEIDPRRCRPEMLQEIWPIAAEADEHEPTIGRRPRQMSQAVRCQLKVWTERLAIWDVDEVAVAQ